MLDARHRPRHALAIVPYFEIAMQVGSIVETLHVTSLQNNQLLLTTHCSLLTIPSDIFFKCQGNVVSAEAKGIGQGDVDGLGATLIWNVI